MESFDVVVIGEGIAGLTAAGLLAKGGRRVASFEANAFGGLVLSVNQLDPAPAGVSASGADYAAALLMGNLKAGVTRFEEPVQSVARGDAGLVVSGQANSVQAPHVIVASGARFNPLGVPGEQDFDGRGVSHCADCDGPMVQGGEVVVVGGGDSAMQEALVLADFASKVHLLVRGTELHGQRHLAEAVRARPNIELSLGTEVTAIEGEKVVKAVVARALADGSTQTIACAGVFPYVGLTANTGFLAELIERDSQGRVKTGQNLATRTPGLWAIGAVRSGGDGLLSGAVADAATVAAAIAPGGEART